MRTLALAALGSLACSCSNPNNPKHLAIAIDVSDPDQKLLFRYADRAYMLESRLNTGDRLTVYFFGHDCDLVYDGPKVSGRSAFNEKIGRKLLQIRSGLATSGTRTTIALDQLAEAARGGKIPTFLVVETDGGIEDLSPSVKAGIAASIRSLKEAPGFRGLAVICVGDQWRIEWKGWLGPLGSRGVVCGSNDDDAARGMWK